jgi:hypothetical protein
MRMYCFENPTVNVSDSGLVNWEDLTASIFHAQAGHLWQLSDLNAGVGLAHPEACFICSCIRESGCFPPGVKISMADGSLRKIEDVRAGDMVRSAKTGAPVEVRQVIEGPEALPLIRFGFEGATLTTSQAHPVLTALGLKPANELKIGDTVFDGEHNPHPLTILETLPIEEGQRVINVKLVTTSSDADERLILSDGIITGDIVLQGLLKKRTPQ